MQHSAGWNGRTPGRKSPSAQVTSPVGLTVARVSRRRRDAVYFQMTLSKTRESCEAQSPCRSTSPRIGAITHLRSFGRTEDKPPHLAEKIIRLHHITNRLTNRTDSESRCILHARNCVTSALIRGKSGRSQPYRAVDFLPAQFPHNVLFLSISRSSPANSGCGSRFFAMGLSVR
jgi:hypothetical protein